MKKVSLSKKFGTAAEMDRVLEKADLSEVFAKKGKLKRGDVRKINLDLPTEVIERIDRIAAKVGIARQPLLKIWIHERLKEEGVGD